MATNTRSEKNLIMEKKDFKKKIRMARNKDETGEGHMAEALVGGIPVAWVPAQASAGPLIGFALLIS